jgi:hypothetical protein
MKRQKQLIDVSKLVIREIRAHSPNYFKTEIPKGNKGMVVRAFAALMETVISAGSHRTSSGH